RTPPPHYALRQASPCREKTLARLTARRGCPPDSSAARRSVGAHAGRCRCDKPRSVVHRLLPRRLRPEEPRPTREYWRQTLPPHNRRPVSHVSSVTFGQANSTPGYARTSIPP